VPDAILGAVDLAIDGGELTGLPSTVVDIAAIDDGGGWEILREGAISEGDLASALASVGLD
jgi:tRNA A37 threonylcarbamoyladenosine synthetase subunit TsaC/SUA5/YrdC